MTRRFIPFPRPVIFGPGPYHSGSETVSALRQQTQPDPEESYPASDSELTSAHGWDSAHVGTRAGGIFCADAGAVNEDRCTKYYILITV
jgi:hypothetical protein